jgi:hypothetical protein
LEYEQKSGKRKKEGLEVGKEKNSSEQNHICAKLAQLHKRNGNMPTPISWSYCGTLLCNTSNVHACAKCRHSRRPCARRAFICAALLLLALGALPVKTSRTTRVATLSMHKIRAHIDWKDESLPYDVCGRHWQVEYGVRHANVLAGNVAPMYAVSLGVDQGLADRMFGTFSVFYYALLTGRAFQIATYPGVVSLREAFEPAQINWHRPDMDDDIIGNIK